MCVSFASLGNVTSSELFPYHFGLKRVLVSVFLAVTTSWTCSRSQCVNCPTCWRITTRPPRLRCFLPWTPSRTHNQPCSPRSSLSSNNSSSTVSTVPGTSTFHISTMVCSMSFFAFNFVPHFRCRLSSFPNAYERCPGQHRKRSHIRQNWGKSSENSYVIIRPVKNVLYPFLSVISWWWENWKEKKR